MLDLDRALADITAIRSQLARGSAYRVYGPATIGATGLLAFLAAGAQTIVAPDPAAAIYDYLGLWIGAAVLAVGLVGIEMIARSKRLHTGLADEVIHAAIEQFIPAGVAGVMLTIVLLQFAPQNLWMLPGLWQIVFSLGVFASCRALPRPMFAVGVWYLAAGLVSLALSSGAEAFSPWIMGLPFGVGQLLMAVVFIRNSEAADGEA